MDDDLVKTHTATLNPGQWARIAAAASGVLMLMLIMGYVVQMGAQRHRTQNPPGVFGQRLEEDDYGNRGRPGSSSHDRALQRARQMASALALTDSQYERLLSMLDDYGYGQRRSDFRRDQEQFYAALAGMLTDDQKVLLQQWRDQHTQGMVNRIQAFTRSSETGGNLSMPQQHSP